MKRCFRCLAEKPLAAFYKHAQMGDGRLNKCIECTKADATRHRLENLEYCRAYDRQRGSRPERVSARKAYQQTDEGKMAMARGRKKYAVTHAVRRKAHIATGSAIKSGRLTKEPCFICGDPVTHAHHADYSRPLSVTWLCVGHHLELHKEHRERLRDMAA